MDKSRALQKPIGTIHEHRDKPPPPPEPPPPGPSVAPKAKDFKPGGYGASKKVKPSKLRWKVSAAIRFLIAEHEEEKRSSLTECTSEAQPPSSDGNDSSDVVVKVTATFRYTRKQMDRLCDEANNQDGKLSELSELERSILARQIRDYLSKVGVQLTASLKEYIQARLQEKPQLLQAVLKIPASAAQSGAPQKGASRPGFKLRVSHHSNSSSPDAKSKKSKFGPTGKKRTMH